MKLNEKKLNGVLKLSFSGRLDAQGAKSLEYDLNDYLRRGEHHILLGLEDTDYISSAGIRILLMFRKNLSAIDGSFSVTVSDKGNVRHILELSGLTMLIAGDHDKEHVHKQKDESFTKNNITFEIMDRCQGGFSISNIGSPEKLVSGTFAPEDSRDFKFPAGTLAMGIGALGNGFENCRTQFGEFLALGGVALTRPPGSTEIDYMLTQEKVIPEGCLLCGLKLEGEFDTVFRFSPQEGIEVTLLDMLCREALEISNSDSIAMVAAVEVADLVGAALAKSPAQKTAAENIFVFPDVQDWLTFTGEPVHKGTTALLAGVVSKEQNGITEKALKPLGENLFGMFKAGVFSYEPLSRDQIDLPAIIQDVFERHKLIDLLHLINDQRALLGVGQSSFLRGTVWCGSIPKQTSNKEQS